MTITNAVLILEKWIYLDAVKYFVVCSWAREQPANFTRQAIRQSKEPWNGCCRLPRWKGDLQRPINFLIISIQLHGCDMTLWNLQMLTYTTPSYCPAYGSRCNYCSHKHHQQYMCFPGPLSSLHLEEEATTGPGTQVPMTYLNTELAKATEVRETQGKKKQYSQTPWLKTVFHQAKTQGSWHFQEAEVLRDPLVRYSCQSPYLPPKTKSLCRHSVWTDRSHNRPPD